MAASTFGCLVVQFSGHPASCQKKTLMVLKTAEGWCWLGVLSPFICPRKLEPCEALLKGEEGRRKLSIQQIPFLARTRPVKSGVQTLRNLRPSRHHLHLHPTNYKHIIKQQISWVFTFLVPQESKVFKFLAKERTKKVGAVTNLATQTKAHRFYFLTTLNTTPRSNK